MAHAVNVWSMTTTDDNRPILYTITDVCRLLRLSRPTVYRLINSGQLASFKIGSNRRVPASSIDSYVASMVAPATGPEAA